MSEEIKSEQTPESTESVETSVEQPEQPVEATDVDVTDAVAEVDEELQEAQQEAAEAQSEEEADAAEEKIKAALKKKLRLKVDGQEIEEEIDLSDEDNLVKQLQLAKVSQKRMNEYAQLEKEVKDFIEALKSDPKKVLSDPSVGIDLKSLAQAVIEEEIENSKKSPEQLEKEKLEAELRALKDKYEQEQEELKRREFERLEQQEAERYDTLMTRALEKSDLPKTPYVVKKMADYMYYGLQEGIDLTPDDVLPLVQEEMHNDIKQMFSVLPEKAIEELIGSEVLGKLRKQRVAKAKKAPKPVKKTVQDTGITGKEEKAAKKKTFKEFFGV